MKDVTRVPYMGPSAPRIGGSAEGAQRFVRLGEASFLWQLSSAFGVIDWSRGIRDLDGDGDDDILIPEPDGYRLLRQDRTESGVTGCQRVWYGQRARPEAMQVLATYYYEGGRVRRLTGRVPNGPSYDCQYSEGELDNAKSQNPGQCPRAADIEPGR